MDFKRAAVYTRVANDTGKKGNSLDQQIAMAREYAIQHNYEVTQVYRDVGSGLKEKRPGLEQMMADAQAGLFDVVILRDPSRLFRNWALFQHYYDLLRSEFGISVMFTIQDDGAKRDDT